MHKRCKGLIGNVLRLGLLIRIIVSLPGLVIAAPIVDLPQSTSGPFRHNAFHSAEWVTGGEKLWWFTLDETQTSTYDPVSGNLEVHVNIYKDQNLTYFRGNAVGTSHDLVGDNFGGNTGAVGGTIQWDFSNLTEDLRTHLGGSEKSVTMTYLDKTYVGSANSWDGKSLTLWGADGYTVSGKYGYGNAYLGSDVVMATPEPSTFLLLGSGIVSLGFWGYRRKG